MSTTQLCFQVKLVSRLGVFINNLTLCLSSRLFVRLRSFHEVSHPLSQHNSIHRIHGEKNRYAL